MPPACGMLRSQATYTSSVVNMCAFLGVAIGIQTRWKDRINKLHMFHNYVENQCPAICGWAGEYMNYKTIKGGCQISFCYQNNIGGWEQRKCYLSFSTSALLPLDQFDLHFELFFACLVSLMKITRLSCWELLQLLLVLISSDSFSFHVVLHLPITMMLYDHFPRAPSCTPTSSVFPEGLDSYTKDIVSCVNCT